MVEGLRYVFRHPVLRAISAMMLLVNGVSVTIYAQLVLFADQRLGVDGGRIGALYAAGSVGVIALSLLAARLRRRWTFSQVALGALMLMGLATVALALTTSFWLALPILALEGGLGTLFNINTGSLRQSIVPNHLLGRIISVAAVLAATAQPVGALAGGVAIERSGNVALVYGIVGVLTTCIACGFAFTALGHAQDFLPAQERVPEPVA
jgi:predicted MFS family arabinose efflux permease